MENNIITANNPWKGLNFYKEGEILYGRNREIETLTQFILANTQTVIYGKSGIGKTSILNAGIFPVVRERGLIPVSIRFDHNSQDSYLKQVQTAVVKSGAKTKELVPVINPEAETLWEYLHRNEFEDANGNPARLMFVFDQFEEIFTLQHDEKRRLAFFAELADVLNDVTPQYITQHLSKNRTSPTELESDQNIKQVDSINDVNLDFIDSDTTQKAHENTYLWSADFHMVFILREDFLSYLERYTIYIPVMKSNRVALLPLNEEQAAEIITRPQEGLVSTSVAELIIRKVTGNQNFTLDGVAEIEVDAAMLSLYLSQLYNKRTSPDEPITAELVDQFGNDIIKDFYESSIAGIPAQTVTILEDELLTYDGRRNNVSRKDLIKMGVPEATIDDLVENKKLLRQFTYDKDMRIEYMHDTLCKVVTARVEQREAEATRAKEEAEKARVAKERERQLFLSQEREQALKRRNKRLYITLIISFVSVVLVAFASWMYFNQEVSFRYGIVVKENGFYKGLEWLTKEKASYRARHYVLYYKGLRQWMKDRPFKLEARNGYGNLTTDTGMITYLLNQYDDEDKGADKTMKDLIATVCQWEFITDRTGTFVVQERAKNEKGETIYSFNRSTTSDPNKVLATYMDEFGLPIMLRDSTYFYLLTTMDEHGHEVLMEFYDDKGFPVTNRDGAYQTRWEHLPNGITKAEYSCFLNGERMIDNAGNCGWINEFDEAQLHAIKGTSLGINLEPRRTTTGDSVVIKKYIYDPKSYQIISQSYWNEYELPDTSKYGCHRVEYEYNRHGQLTRQIFFNRENNRCALKNGLEEIVNQYDETGRQILEEYRFTEGTNGWRITYMSDGRILRKDEYTIKSSEDTIFTYHQLLNPETRAEIRQWCGNLTVRVAYDEKWNMTSWAFYDSTNTACVDAYGYHDDRTEYFYQGATTTTTKIYYDSNEHIVKLPDKYPIQVTIVDSLKCTKTTLNYSEDSIWICSFRSIYSDNTFMHKIAEESVNRHGETARSYSNAACYYRANIIYPIKPTLRDSLLGWIGENEFGEPSIIYDKYTAYSTQYTYKDTTKYFTPHGYNIPEGYTDWWVFGFVEIKNSQCTFGFKDGDVVLACNQIYWTKDGATYYDWLRLVDRDFLVARYNGDKNEYDTAHVYVPADVQIKKYVEFNAQYCTAREQERLDSISKQYFTHTMVYGESADTTSIAYRSGLTEIYVLDLLEWNFLDDYYYDIVSVLKEGRQKHKHMIYWDIPTQSIKILDTDDQMMGIHMMGEDLPLDKFEFIKQKYLEYQQQK